MHFSRKLCLLLAFAFATVFVRGQTVSKTFQITSTSTVSCPAIDVGGNATVGIDVSGTFSATLQPQVIIGGGNTPRNTGVTPYGSTTSQATITAAGGYHTTDIPGATYFVMCASAYVSGTATVVLTITPASAKGGGGGGGAGTVTNLATGPGLTGGPITSTGTIALATPVAVANGGTGVTTAQGNGTKVQLSTGTTTTNDCAKFDANGNTVDNGSACPTGGGVIGQVKGESTTGGATSTATGPSPVTISVAAYCGDFTGVTCPGFVTEAEAIRSIITTVGCNTAAGGSCNIVDDMVGTQYWDETPWPTNFTGRIDIKTNGAAHQILVDGTSTLGLSTDMQLHGMGGTSSDQIAENTSIADCNNLTDICPNGGFVTQNTSATTIALSVTGSVMTVTLTTGTPFSVNGNAINQLAKGRWIQISGASNANDNGAFMVASVTQSTSPQIFTLNVDSTSQATCAAPCGAAIATLETPLLSFGPGGGNGTFHTRFGDLVLDGHGVLGGTAFVNGQGEEGTGTDGPVQMYNFPVGCWRLEQSGIFGGNGTIGTTNAGPYGSLSCNFNPWIVTKVAGAPCSNTSVGTCTAGNLVPAGSAIAIGVGTQNFGVLTPSPIVNPNWWCGLVSGTAGNQGTGIIERITCSDQDKTQAGLGIFTPVGKSQPIGIIVAGQHISLGDVHTEFMQNAINICPDSAITATVQETYGTILTSGVNLVNGGFIGYVGGSGIGIDIGTTGGGSVCSDINILGVNIGAGSGPAILKDNITGNTIAGSGTEVVETYMLGHGTPPSVWSSSPTVSQVMNRLTVGTTSSASTPAGVVNVTTGFQIGSAAPNAHILAGNGTNYVDSLAGVPVDATNPGTLLSTDRANYLRWTSGTTLALPAVAGSFASNFPFAIQNTSATLTITPNAGASDLIDGASSGTIIPNFAAFVYQDSTTAPGHWFTIKYPTFAAFGSTCANPLSWSTATGFACLTGTSGGVPYFSAANTWGTSGALTSNVLIKGGGAGNPPTPSLITDTGTTATYTGTGGILSPIFTANGATAGFVDLPQGSTSSAVSPCNTANSHCIQAGTATTYGLETDAPALAQGIPTRVGAAAAVTDGYSGDAGHSTTISTSTATSVGSTSLCSTVLCPAGTYVIHAYIDVTTACTTTGTYLVSIIYTDDTTVSKTIVMPLIGTGVTATLLGPSANSSSLSEAATTNFGQGTFVLRSTGAASINYSTTAGACGSGGPGLGKLYLSAVPLQ